MNSKVSSRVRSHVAVVEFSPEHLFSKNDAGAGWSIVLYSIDAEEAGLSKDAFRNEIWSKAYLQMPSDVRSWMDLRLEANSKYPVPVGLLSAARRHELGEVTSNHEAEWLSRLSAISTMMSSALVIAAARADPRIADKIRAAKSGGDAGNFNATATYARSVLSRNHGAGRQRKELVDHVREFADLHMPGKSEIRASIKFLESRLRKLSQKNW